MFLERYLLLAFLISFVLQNWTVHGLYWGSYAIHRPHVLEDSLKELLSWLARGLITIKISHTFSLSEVRNNLSISSFYRNNGFDQMERMLDDRHAAFQYIVYFLFSCQILLVS